MPPLRFGFCRGDAMHRQTGGKNAAPAVSASVGAMPCIARRAARMPPYNKAIYIVCFFEKN